MGKRTMSLQDACDLVDDDLPDGAFFAMAHDIAGAEYGTAWGELDGYVRRPRRLLVAKEIPCPVCRKRFARNEDLRQHREAAHPEGELKMYVCSVCGKLSTREASIAQHMAAAHKRKGGTT